MNNVSVISGHGQYFSDKNGDEFLLITYEDIVGLVDDPQNIVKKKAKWMLPSSLPSRNANDQREKGTYSILWCDFDNDPLPIDQVAKIADEIGCDYEIYTSKSAKEDLQKSRLSLPLRQPLACDDWTLSQESLNDFFDAKGAKTDRASEGAAQLCYLPNKGDFYDSKSKREGISFAPLGFFNEEINEKREAIKAAQKATERRIADSKAKREQRLSEGIDSPIDAFNTAHCVEDILLQSGYKQRGNTFSHPNSESGSYSASVKNGRVHSLSTSDPLYTGGGGIGAHDAFSAFCVLYHGGNTGEALYDACENWITREGESWNKYRRQVDGIGFSDLSQQDSDKPNSPLSILNSWSANGRSEEMKKQMLDDAFILKDLAILGQWTVFYASPGTGKTLLTLWLLRESINSGELNGKDVFYANCDDTYKGGVEKLTIAEDIGFNMLLPNESGFEKNDLVELMVALAKANEAKGKVIVLDTLKKFTDLMDKTKASIFSSAVREFVSAGGSIISLAHVNKHKNESGKSVHAGTSDILDDADCCYVIEKLGEEEDDGFSMTYTVAFESQKQRGDVANTATFKYTKGVGSDYLSMLESIERVSDEDRAVATAKEIRRDQREEDQHIINYIQGFISEGDLGKSDLVKKITDESAESRRKVIDVIGRWASPSNDDGLWYLDKQDKNKHIYKMNRVY